MWRNGVASTNGARATTLSSSVAPPGLIRTRSPSWKAPASLTWSEVAPRSDGATVIRVRANGGGGTSGGPTTWNAGSGTSGAGQGPKLLIEPSGQRRSDRSGGAVPEIMVRRAATPRRTQWVIVAVGAGIAFRRQITQW